MLDMSPFNGYSHGDHWKVRALCATQGNQTGLGAVLCAILGRTPARPPRFIGPATIWDNGHIIADFQARGQLEAWACDIGPIGVVVDNMRRLADYCHMTDAERIELFQQFHKWIERDLRAKSTLD
jgi:hypothetical protein